MVDSNKVTEYRRALHNLARQRDSRTDASGSPARAGSQDAADEALNTAAQELEGKAAKLALEIQGEESKAVPAPPQGTTTPSRKPSRPTPSRPTPAR